MSLSNLESSQRPRCFRAGWDTLYLGLRIHLVLVIGFLLPGTLMMPLQFYLQEAPKLCQP